VQPSSACCMSVGALCSSTGNLLASGEAKVLWLGVMSTALFPRLRSCYVISVVSSVLGCLGCANKYRELRREQSSKSNAGQFSGGWLHCFDEDRRLVQHRISQNEECSPNPALENSSLQPRSFLHLAAMHSNAASIIQL
jgi:hypothetical protein